MSENPKVIVVEDVALPNYPEIYKQMAAVLLPEVDLEFVSTFVEAEEQLSRPGVMGLISEVYTNAADSETILVQLKRLRERYPDLPICVWSDLSFDEEDPFIRFKKSQWEQVCQFFLTKKRKTL